MFLHQIGNHVIFQNAQMRGGAEFLGQTAERLARDGDERGGETVSRQGSEAGAWGVVAMACASEQAATQICASNAMRGGKRQPGLGRDGGERRTLRPFRQGEE